MDASQQVAFLDELRDAVDKLGDNPDKIRPLLEAASAGSGGKPHHLMAVLRHALQYAEKHSVPFRDALEAVRRATSKGLSAADLACRVFSRTSSASK